MSTLKVNKIRDTAGSADSITLDPNGGAVIAGVTTVSTVKVGSGVTITSDGDIFHTGVCTATSFAGEIPVENTSPSELIVTPDPTLTVDTVVTPAKTAPPLGSRVIASADPDVSRILLTLSVLIDYFLVI